ncbi:MAG: hypothetical protein G3M70_02505 [Candidatus Nitronauta litoralis]|uniref:Uncharacterized protein n=1 Tax=Candidatus Nitronauta litoralis TaxID=2705533 RepID=A0A7T0BUQ6_9BACT|nr:MAG: hypothetical protein G3M70_02505 [Candidatus Nitronauta litoralis]
MRKLILVFAIVSLFPSTAAANSAVRLYKKSHYQIEWCRDKNGVAGYPLPEGSRVDCLLEDYAVEFGYADEWAQCIGLALYHAQVTGRDPACGLIMEHGEPDEKFLKRLLISIKDSSHRWRVWKVEPDIIDGE